MTRRSFLIKGLLAFTAFLLAKGGLKPGLSEAASMKAAPGPKGKADKMKGAARARVVSVRSESATRWDHGTYPYVDSIDEGVVERMLNESIKELASEADVAAAWKRLFASYKKGETIAIKPNFNDLYDGFKGFVASPAVLNAVIGGLVKQVGVPEADIVVYDCTRVIPDEFRERVHFSVRYAEPFGSSFFRKVRYKTFGNDLVKADLGSEVRMSSAVKDKKGASVKCYMPKAVTGAAHLINIPILKSHQYASNSGALKNHYGTVRFSDGKSFPEYLHPPILDASIVDINSHPEIRSKTRLIVMDGLFGRLAKKGGPPERWKTFGGAAPNTLLASLDPVALDTVALDLLSIEAGARGEELLPHEYLHLAHAKGLGVHEDAAPGKGFTLIDLRSIKI
ncbi:MAG: DUF362 domain-containing protein [Deltaproteobacteria bacterium]|nr:DUF362 domain-containing protein [Deltaproteobacteria bacterium]